MKKRIQLLLGIINHLILSLFIILLKTNVAFAYIDPGTGSFILQSILAVFATIVFYLGYPIRFIKSFLKKFSKKENNLKTDKEKNN